MLTQVSEKEQVSVLNELTTILSNFENIDVHVIFACDFSIFFSAMLDAKGSIPTSLSITQRIFKKSDVWIFLQLIIHQFFVQY